MEINPQEFRILLVDDEPDILEFLSYNLTREGFEIFTAQGGREAIELVSGVKPHLVLLDLMMPGMDGMETCELLRKIPDQKNLLIAFLTARAEDYSQIAGFEAGADDYITKPVKPRVLISRIKAMLKRFHPLPGTSHPGAQEVNTGTGLMVDREKYLVFLDGEEIVLPRKEFELLWLLYSRPDKTFSRAEIYHTIWGDEVIVSDRNIDVHIRKLRERIGEDRIITIKGVGYKYTSDKNKISLP